jgi:hypothetical protein
MVIYSYNKSQQDALFLKFILDEELHMFRTDLLSPKHVEFLVKNKFEKISLAFTTCKRIYLKKV